MTKKEPIKREYSAGGVVFRQNGKKIEWLLIQPKGTDRWQLPKGRLDEDEKSPTAAVREVKEETGIQARSLGKIDAIRYIFHQDGQRIFKTVSFFLMEDQGGKPIAQEGEIEKVSFFPEEEAERKLTFSNEKEILAKAKKILAEKKKQPGLF